MPSLWTLTLVGFSMAVFVCDRDGMKFGEKEFIECTTVRAHIQMCFFVSTREGNEAAFSLFRLLSSQPSVQCRFRLQPIHSFPHAKYTLFNVFVTSIWWRSNDEFRAKAFITFSPSIWKSRDDYMIPYAVPKIDFVRWFCSASTKKRDSNWISNCVNWMKCQLVEFKLNFKRNFQRQTKKWTHPDQLTT